MEETKVVTAADSDYFYSLMTLLTTLFHRGNLRGLDVDVWDLGLTERQLKLLNLVDFVKIKKFEFIKEPFEGAFGISPNSYTWKIFAIRESMTSNKNILWLDAGVAVASKLDLLNNFDSPVFFRNNDYKNRDWTSSECAKTMMATELELNAFQLHANILYFPKESEISRLIVTDWVKWGSLRSVSYSSDTKHRHDQSILSILASRMRVELLNQDQYILEDENYQMAVDSNILFLAHRRKFSWVDLNALIKIKL